ncbi:hypothetical protein O181_045806 [Austropuccinia psidii MF-1]|uniref:Retroviral polymerase SH3-like domain-containing protein n=1 Tax=Austropuccinia psidii MF-1 TaxID=1389203 RepID=A0A9Q3DSZ9_9BASI|nr:hypothetical protein [Austropuccinia psidii MF-1]
MEMLCGRKPQPFRIYPFGTKAIVHAPEEKRGKLDDRGRICKLIGSKDYSRGFFWDEENKQIIDPNCVEFLDYMFEQQAQEKMNIQNLINKIELQSGQEKTNQICKSQDDIIEHIPIKHNLSIPSNLKDAKKDGNWQSWLEVTNRELKSFDEMEVWKAVYRETGMKIIKTHLIFDIKKMTSPNNIAYKAQLVAQSFCQCDGINCKHTYAPTALLSSLQWQKNLGG